MLKLLGKILFISIIGMILSFCLDSLYRHTYGLEYQLPKNLIVPSAIDKPYEIVALGNSHVESGLTFEGYRQKSLSLASVAQSFEYDLAMLKMNSKRIKKGAIIIINVSPLSFSQKKPKREDDINMNYYDGRLSPYLIPNFKPAEYLQLQIVPFVRAGYLWREKYAQEVLDRAMNAYAMAWKKPETEIATPETRVPEPTGTAAKIMHIHSSIQTFWVREIEKELLTPPDPPDERLSKSAHDMTDKWLHGEFDTAYFVDNRKDLQTLIGYCMKKQWRPVLITLPISEVLKDDLGPTYLQRYVYDHVTMVNTYGLKYIDFSSNTTLTKNTYLFGNSDHLNGRGAGIVSYLLLKELIDMGYLPKEADGYDYE